MFQSGKKKDGSNTTTATRIKMRLFNVSGSSKKVVSFSRKLLMSGLLLFLAPVSFGNRHVDNVDRAGSSALNKTSDQIVNAIGPDLGVPALDSDELEQAALGDINGSNRTPINQRGN